MNLAILFWFYKEPEVCENRLQLLKKHNPDLKIFGLYGGVTDQAEEYKNKLGKYLDDFYTFTTTADEDWKWIHGDLMILDWYDKRGRNLAWDSIAVVQWDMLIFDSLAKQFSGIKEGEVFLSGTRYIDEELENKWDWVKRGSKDGENYLAFLDYVKEKYAYSGKPLASLFIFEILPKVFFEKYLAVENKEIGMLEYKVPIYSQIFGTPFYEKELGTKWYGVEASPLNAIPEEISDAYIKDQLSQKVGWRIFHPYFKIWNDEN
jgi:hypothetical protein